MGYPIAGIVSTGLRPNTNAGISGVYNLDTARQQKLTNTNNWPQFLYAKGTEYIIANGYTPSSWNYGYQPYGTHGWQEFIKLRLLKNDPQYAQAWCGWHNDTTHCINYVVMKVNKLDGVITTSPVQVGAALTTFATFGPFAPGGNVRRVRWDAASDPANSRFWTVHYDDSYVTSTPYNPNPFGFSYQLTIRATAKVNVGTADTSNTITTGTANITGNTFDRYIYGNQDTRRPAPNQFWQDYLYYDNFAVKAAHVGSNKLLCAFGDKYATITSPDNNTATFSTNSATISGTATTVSSTTARNTNSSSKIVPCGTNYGVHLYSYFAENSYMPAYYGNTNATVATVIDHSANPPTMTHHWFSRQGTTMLTAVGLGTTNGATQILAGIGSTGTNQVTGPDYLTILQVNNTTGVLTTKRGNWGAKYWSSTFATNGFAYGMTNSTSLYPYSLDRGNIISFDFYDNDVNSVYRQYVAVRQANTDSLTEPLTNYGSTGNNYSGASPYRSCRTVLKIDQTQFIEVGYASSAPFLYGRLVNTDPTAVNVNSYIV